MNYKWRISPANTNQPNENLKNYNKTVQALLAQLGITDKLAAEEFLNPTATNLTNALEYAEVDKICDFLATAIKNKSKIFVHGDFDVDGIVSTSILWDFLYHKLGADITPFIPNRFTEGYGLSDDSLARIIEAGGEIVITVDCGIKNIDLIKNYPNLKFIITDHHTYPTDENGNKLRINAPNLVGVMHPQHPDNDHLYAEVCGAHVTWQLIRALAHKLDTKNFDPNEYIYLVGMATVTDIMPLIGENRYLVKKGLEQINTSIPMPLKSILDVSKLEVDEISSYHYGYVFGPRLNAAGRIEDAMDGVRLLSTKNEQNAAQLAQKLDDLNKQRQELTVEFLQKSEDQIQSQKANNILFVYGIAWPEGILGLVAGKLQQKYHRPTLVMSLNEETQIIKGSARSMESYNITEALKRHTNLLTKFGGHAQAAGFSLELKNLEQFKSEMLIDATANITSQDLMPHLDIVGELHVSELNQDIIDTLKTFEPFGYGNPAPVFLFSDLTVLENKTIGNLKKHLRMNLMRDDVHTQAIGFNMAEKFDQIAPGHMIDIAGTPRVNVWNGNTYYQIEIRDIRTRQNNT